jgi:hypothetical protein
MAETFFAILKLATWYIKLSGVTPPIRTARRSNTSSYSTIAVDDAHRWDTCPLSKIRESTAMNDWLPSPRIT